jgi:hypothetical protein
MAVVSISRIQVRRGQKNVGSGLPQLASGEFGWAVDSQELFIGNGSVAEGSPFVGNTKLLSETDNLFEFANTYQYKSGTNVQTGNSANNPVLRTLQQRLDDRISIRSFGANGDGTNQTAALQRAIDQLYLNASNKGTTAARVELILEAGEYTTASTIYLPPYATIRGAGPEKTIINSTAFPAFQTANETSTPGVYAADSTSTTLNQARNITISDLTITTLSAATSLSLVSCKDSTFENLVLRGTFALGASATPATAINMTSLSTAVSSNSNTFTNVKAEKFDTGVRSDNDIKDNRWTGCTFDTLRQGFAFGVDTILGTSGMLYGPLNNKISNSIFSDIYLSAIKITTGTNNTSSNNKFYSVGNEGGSSLLAAHSIIEFTDIKNSSEGDWFQRSEELGYDEAYKNGVVYHPEVKGPTITEFNVTHKLDINNSGEFSKLFRLPAETGKAYEIDYIYKSNVVDALRSGVMSLVVDPSNDTLNFSDDYNYTGNSLYANDLEFIAQNYDEDGDTTIDTVAIMIKNTTANNVLGTISGLTLANPLVVTTSNNPNITNGQEVLIAGITADNGSGIHELNNNNYYVDSITNTVGTTYTFELYTDKALVASVDGTALSPYVSGGTVSNSENASLYYKVKTKL